MGEQHFVRPAEVDVREVELKAGAARLRALLAVPPSPCGWVIFAHEGGNSLHGSAHRSVARALNQAGLATLSMELLTAAEAVNRRKAFETPLLAERLMAGAEWLGAESGAGVGCFGAGEGAAAALWAAGEKGSRIQSLAACAPRLDLVSDRLGEVRASTLLIVGGADRRALKQVRWARKRLGSSELIVVPGATRLFDAPAALRALADHSVEWFKRTVSTDAKILEAARAGLSRETRRRLAAAASLLMLSGFIIGPKVVHAAVTASWNAEAGDTGMLRVTWGATGDQVTVGASGGQVALTDQTAATVSITGGPVNAADVRNIRIGSAPAGITGDPGQPAGDQRADLSAVSTANGFTGLSTTGQPISIGAGAGNDTLIGSAFGDRYWDGNDQDVIYGNDGPDSLFAGAGNDYVDGGAGNDTLDGMNGADTVLGGDGDDLVMDATHTAAVTDVHDGGAGTDLFWWYNRNAGGNIVTVLVGDAQATFNTAAGADPDGVWTYTNFESLRIVGSEGSDLFDASLSAIPVILQGTLNNDVLIGSQYDDTLLDDRGLDTLNGGGGTDVAAVGEINARQAISATQGALISLVGSAGPVHIQTGDVPAGADIPMTSMERFQFIGCDFYDTNLAAGGDTLNGSADTAGIIIDGNGGNDLITGGSGNDTLNGNNNNDVIAGNDGNDSLTGGADSDNLNGGAGDDTLRSDRGWDTLDGGAGTGDLVNIGETNARQAIDTVNGQGVLISLLAAAGPIQVRMAEVNAGALTTIPVANVERYAFTGNDYNNTTIATSGDTLDGAADTLGIDISGNNGNDLITGGSGNDTLNGNGQNDTITAGNGNDLLNGGNQNDYMDGGAGDDAYVFSQSTPDWGVDALADASGSDTADFSADTVSLVVDMGGSINVVGGASQVSSPDAIENVIGGPLSDSFRVVPSASYSQYADGGLGDTNRLSYDGTAATPPVNVNPGPNDTTPGTISGGGVQDVLFLNFAEVNTGIVSNARVWQVFE